MAPVPLQVKLGLTVARLRRSQGYSQEKFADVIKIHRTYMGKLEQGRVNLGLRALEKLAKGLGLKPSALLAEAEKERGS